MWTDMKKSVEVLQILPRPNLSRLLWNTRHRVLALLLECWLTNASVSRFKIVKILHKNYPKSLFAPNTFFPLISFEKCSKKESIAEFN